MIVNPDGFGIRNSPMANQWLLVYSEPNTEAVLALEVCYLCFASTMNFMEVFDTEAEMKARMSELNLSMPEGVQDE